MTTPCHPRISVELTLSETSSITVHRTVASPRGALEHLEACLADQTAWLTLADDTGGARIFPKSNIKSIKFFILDKGEMCSARTSEYAPALVEARDRIHALLDTEQHATRHTMYTELVRIYRLLKKVTP